MTSLSGRLWNFLSSDCESHWSIQIEINNKFNNGIFTSKQMASKSVVHCFFGTHPKCITFSMSGVSTQHRIPVSFLISTRFCSIFRFLFIFFSRNESITLYILFSWLHSMWRRKSIYCVARFMCVAGPMPILNCITFIVFDAHFSGRLVCDASSLYKLSAGLCIFVPMCDRFLDSILFIVIFMCEPRLLHHSNQHHTSPQTNTFSICNLFPFNPIDVMEIDKGVSRGASTNTSSSQRGK